MEINGYVMSAGTPVARVENGKTYPLEKGRMPLYLASGGDLERWLQSRAIDRHRTNSRILKKVLRLNDTSDVAAVLHAHGATITDNYWFRPDSDPGLRYEQVRFTENQFSDLALTGSFESYNKDFPDTTTPELTNIGSFEKCWRIEGGTWYLYKQGNALERFSELFISRLGLSLGFKMAEYQQDGNYLKSKDFTEGKYNFEPAAAIVGDNEDYLFNYNKLQALRDGMGKQYLDILYLDALAQNMDRHTYNYGVLRDPATGGMLQMAPNFDNNIALIARGYGAAPSGSNGLLIDLFLDLLRRIKTPYHTPVLERGHVLNLAVSTLPHEGIDREYVTEFIMDRYQRLEKLCRTIL